MTLNPGTRLGPYEILSPLGAGGMGEVYRARDTRLGRDVAVKVLPHHLSSNPEVRARFEREAKTVSSLNHPHICTLHDVGREGDIDYLVMELIEGETLAARVARGPLPPADMLKIGAQIADALDRAHRAGVIHRDLKPGNVMLTKSGAKLMDFGLARASGLAGPTSTSGIAMTQSPTIAQPLTAEGTIVGTFQYMSPEQLEGKEADARSDVWAFGCVLYEMATGRKAFSGASQASLISAIMKEEPPPISSVEPMSPPALDRVVKTCLAKDPEDRWQSLGDLRNELNWIAASGSQTGVAAPAIRRRGAYAWIPWAAALILAAAAFEVGRRLHSAPPPTVLRASIALPPYTDFQSQNTSLAVSPDGRILAFAGIGADGKRQLWVRAMSGFGAQPLAGTDGADIPFWSPDGRFIGFFADGKLKKIPAAGGTVQTICDAPDGRGASWSSRDVIVFAPLPYGGLSRVSAAGGVPSALTQETREGYTHRLPHFGPDGKRLLFFMGSPTMKDDAIYGLDIDSGESTLVAKEHSEGRYAEPGYLLFMREGNLMAQPMDAARLKTSGEAVPIAEAVSFYTGRWNGNFSVSRTGLLVFQSSAAARRRQLTWFNVDGKELSKVGEPAIFVAVTVAPDARRAAVTLGSGKAALNPEVWLYELGRGVASRFTFGSEGTAHAQWSPDSRDIVYAILSEGLAIKSAEGTSEPRTVWPTLANVRPLSWSSDGNFILFRLQDTKTGGQDLWVLPMEGDRKARPLIATPAEEAWGAFSPDGRWLAYISNESGRREVYVVPFPELGQKRQVSTGGCVAMFWLGERRIGVVQPSDNKLLAVDLEIQGSSLTVGASHLIFGGEPLPRISGLFGATYAPTRDGKRLLIAVPIDEDAGVTINLVTNWAEELKP